VRQLRKPSAPAWAINQLARRQSEKIRRLVKEEDALRNAHGASADRFREALEAERTTVAALVEDAAAIFEDSGRPATDATLERISTTLHAAAADPERREELLEGRLTEELEPLGFEALAGVQLPARAAAPQRAKEETASSRRAADRQLRDAARAARTEARRLEQEADRAEREARAARERADKASKEADRLEAELAEPES
jgi:hypothetical protein